MYENRREIMQDVFLTYLPADKFKTSRLTLNLITGLRRENMILVMRKISG